MLNQKKHNKLINSIETAPKESLLGVVLLYPHIRILDIGNTVVRKEYQAEECTKLISGGPTGHEPMYSGYIGKGMLTAAIQGNLFQSPSTYEIYNVIKEISFRRPEGLLVIIPNSNVTINFGLAVEKAIIDGVQAKVIVMTDDCTDQSNFNKSGRPQGLTGTLIMQKIAGSMIDGYNKSLNEVFNYCTSIQKSLSTILINLKPVSLLENLNCTCLKAKSIQIGGGLHGGKGRSLEILSARMVIEESFLELHNHFKFSPEVPVVLLVNNMCCSILEENIVISELLQQMLSLNIPITRVYVGTFMTSLDMQGFTVTVMQSDEETLKYLDFPTEAPSWKMKTFGVEPEIQENIKPRVKVMSYPRIQKRGPKLSAKHSNTLLLVVQFACDALISCKRQLDIIDSENGDGDTGRRLSRAAETILEGVKLDEINLEYPYVFFKMLSKICDGISGLMGALYSICFESCANTFANLEENVQIDESIWIECLKNVIDAIKMYTVADENGSNILTPMVACYNAIVSARLSMDEQSCLMDAFGGGVSAAEEAAKGTTRSDMKYPDPGAHSVGIWMRAVYEGVKFRYVYPK